MIDEDERALGEALHGYADDLTPEPGVYEGLRRRRQRRAAGSRVAVAAAVVAVVAVPVAATRVLGGTAPRPGPAMTSAASPTATTAGAPAEFDPLARVLTVGGLPTALSQLSTSGDRTTQQLRAAAPGPTMSYVTVVATPTGHPPADIDQHRVPDGDVNGAPAWIWCSKEIGFTSCSRLVWEWAPGAWAAVDTTQYQADLPARVALAHTIAAGVVVGTPVPVAFPYYLAGLPAGSTAAGWTATTTYGQPEAALQVDTAAGPYLLRTFAEVPTGDYPFNDEVDGTQVRIEHDQDGTWTLNAPSFHGLNVTIQRVPDSSVDGMKALFRAIHPVGDPHDPSTWTADVVR